MSPRWRTWRLAGIAAAAALLAAAATSAALARSGGTRTSSASDTLVDGTTDSVTNIDPANEYDYGTFTLDLLIFQGLYGFPHSSKLEPVLATGCKTKGTAATWVCTLRRNVKFSDGTPMTSADVKWSFDRVVKIKGDQGIYALLSNLKSVSTNGPYSVTFHLKSPQSTWPFILATNAGYVVPKSLYPADKIRDNSQSQVGSGPYELVKYTPGQQAVFKANPNFWGPKPKTENLIINYYSKSSTMKLALQRGEIDMAFRDFTPTELTSLKTASGITVHSGNGVVIRYLVFNPTRPPTNNIAVRKAIAYLFPRQTIASRVYHGFVQPLYSMVPAGLPGHIDAFKTVYGASPSVAKARAVLKAAGVKTPVAIDIWWTPSHYGDASADEYAEIQRALNSSGLFKVTLKSAEWAQYSASPGKRYNAFQLGWFPDYPDAEDYIVPFYQPDNFMANGYNDPKMTALIKKEYAATSTPARLGVIKQAQMLAAKDVPIIPYWQGKMVAVSRNNVHGIDSTLDAAFNMRFWLLSKS
ncbi:MAG TPA: ABC transporter substrate-binding protein [Gaiellaceae bacterium]|nr:ABC transporter substrate-binding protein [Gaiellaceae bacterium]